METPGRVKPFFPRELLFPYGTDVQSITTLHFREYDSAARNARGKHPSSLSHRLVKNDFSIGMD
jgi:hypothetical protein